MVTIICYNCDGTGLQPFLDNGCRAQETCEVCQGNKTLEVTEEFRDGLLPQAPVST